MSRRDITGTIDSIGADYKQGMNRYNATTSFKRDGITYFIEINDMYGTNTLATWWDNSDNGFGYNNYGDVYVNNPFNRMTGSFSPENIDDYIGVNSAYNRNLPTPIKRAIINRVKKYIDYDALNDVRRGGRNESIKKDYKRAMKLRINEGFAHPLYQLVDAETDEIIEVFSNEDSAEKYAKQYIMNYATEDDPVAVDCYVIEDEDALEYPKYIDEPKYIWTLDSRNGNIY